MRSTEYYYLMWVKRFIPVMNENRSNLFNYFFISEQ